MERIAHRMLAGALLSAALASCSSPFDAQHENVDIARAVWLNAGATDYRFEVSMATSWTPAHGYYQVVVSSRDVVSAVDPNGQTVESFSLTIDRIWDRILNARSEGELNSARFNSRGVPIETDLGPWEVDGGAHYSVRNFAKTTLQ